MDKPDASGGAAAVLWRERFFAGWAWLILRNVLGWSLMLVAFVAGPLIPGPGGIPLFLIGFALVSLPGKRRLTARVLRGRPIRFNTPWFSRIVQGIALAVSVAALTATRPWNNWPMQGAVRAFAIVGMYVLGAVVAWAAMRVALHAANGLLRLAPRVRRRVRPWLRRHHIRLLPPRWRHHSHERGHARQRIKDEVLKLGRQT